MNNCVPLSQLTNRAIFIYFLYLDNKVRKSHTIKNKQLDVKKALPKNEMDRMNNRGGSGGREMNNRSFGPRNDRNSGGPNWNNNRSNNSDGWANSGPYNNGSNFSSGSNGNWNHSNSQPAPWNNNPGSQGEGK